jgi:hypothetical protein
MKDEGWRMKDEGWRMKDEENQKDGRKKLKIMINKNYKAEK